MGVALDAGVGTGPTWFVPYLYMQGRRSTCSYGTGRSTVATVLVRGHTYDQKTPTRDWKKHRRVHTRAHNDTARQHTAKHRTTR